MSYPRVAYRDLNLSEDSVEIDYEIKVFCKKHRRLKSAKTCACNIPAIITAPKMPQIIPEGKFGTAFLVRAIIRAKEGNSALIDWSDDWITDIHILDALNDERVACRNNQVDFAEKQALLEGQSLI